MQAVTITPGKAHSLDLRGDHPSPELSTIDAGDGVLVRVLQVGLCGTDREIIEGLYGAAPDGSSYLVLGHENLGVVEAVGPAVTQFSPGDLVVSMVRRPGNSLYDLVGAYDLTTDDVYRECGINLLHGFLTERYAASEKFLIKAPRVLSDIGVLLEPMSVIEKGVAHALNVQRRLPLWNVERAAVLGAGPIGLLATMLLRLRNMEVVTFALPEQPNLNATLAEQVGAQYVSARQKSFRETSAELGPFDLIFEATGHAPLLFEAMEVLGKNGVLVASGLSGGGRNVTIPADAINTGFVLH
ncbi:MAG: alcohol dehydrogenase catalytic domain-containing protein, partial [Dehalococcoidia bacterium]